jgi:hypothetical protein
MLNVMCRKLGCIDIATIQRDRALADLAVGSLQHKRQQLEQALSGRVREHYRFLIASHLSHLDFLEAQIAAAVAHRLLKAAYYILTKRQPYQDLGANYLERKGKEHLLTRLCRGIKQLGYEVSLQLSSLSTS